jgi:2-haloacid dehalogenase
MAASPPSLSSSFSVIGFDTMGTLLDEKAGIKVASAAIREKLPSNISDEQFFKKFETHLREQMRTTPPPTPYPTILGKAISLTAHSFSNGEYSATESERDDFARALADWPAFDDTVASLQYLAEKHKLVALSNMDTATLVELTTTGALRDVPFAKLQGGDKTGAFKPDHRVNQALLDVAQDEFGVGKEQVLLVAQGLGSDHVPARDMGIASAWIDRYGAGKDAAAEARPTWIFSSMKELVEEMKRQSRT